MYIYGEFRVQGCQGCQDRHARELAPLAIIGYFGSPREA
jgi:hypothetical protein